MTEIPLFAPARDGNGTAVRRPARPGAKRRPPKGVLRTSTGGAGIAGVMRASTILSFRCRLLSGILRAPRVYEIVQKTLGGSGFWGDPLRDPGAAAAEAQCVRAVRAIEAAVRLAYDRRGGGYDRLVRVQVGLF